MKNYNLVMTEREYIKDTLASFYFQSTETTTKKLKPINIDGERKRINLQTGEITDYTRRDFETNSNCSIRHTSVMLNMLLEMNMFDWFGSLTFDNEKLDRTDDTAVMNAYIKYINNLKHQHPNVRYITIVERHEDGSIHFHPLFGGITPQELGLVNSGKVCCHWARNGENCSKSYYEKTKHLHNHTDTDGLTIYNISNFIYGFTTVTRIQSREKTNSYVKKYIKKSLGSTDIFKKRFYYSANLNVPNIVKKLIGADFDEPKEIQNYYQVMLHDYVRNSKMHRVSEHNVLQVRIDNSLKKLLEIQKDKKL